MMSTINGYVFQLSNTKDWIGSPSEDWEIEMISFKQGKRLGNRSIDGDSVEVFELEDGTIVAQTTAFLNGR